MYTLNKYPIHSLSQIQVARKKCYEKWRRILPLRSCSSKKILLVANAIAPRFPFSSVSLQTTLH